MDKRLIVANGKLVDLSEGEVVLVNHSSCLHLMFVGHWTGGNVSISWKQQNGEGTLMFDCQHRAPTPKVLTLMGEAVVHIQFEEHDRHVDCCSADALRFAIQCLKTVEMEETPRIGAVASEHLFQLLAERLGVDRLLSHVDMETLFHVDEISAFASKDEGIACVAKHTSHKHQPIDEFADSVVCEEVSVKIPSLVKMSCAGSVRWRSVAASFSTMMRYFQKTKDEFCWKPDRANKTVIKAF